MGRLSSFENVAAATACQSQSATATAAVDVDAALDVDVVAVHGSMPLRGGLLLKEAARANDGGDEEEDGTLFRNERADERKIIDV